MSQEQKNPEKFATIPNPTEGEDDEYEEYLLWPSLISRNVSSGPRDTPLSPYNGPVSLHSETTEYDYSALGSEPPSPITFAPPRDFLSRFATEPDFGAPPSPELPKEHKSEPAKYSPIFKLGLYLSQLNHFLNRAIDGIKLKARKPRSQSAVSIPMGPMGKPAPDL